MTAGEPIAWLDTVGAADVARVGGKAASLGELGRALAAGPRELVWNVRAMSGYEAGAREAWQHVMWPSRKQIRSIKLIGGPGLVRVGATFLAVLIGVPLTTES